MRWQATLPADSTGRPRVLWLAVLISAALHGLFGLGLCMMSAVRSTSADKAPLAEIAVVIVPDAPLTVSLPIESLPTMGGATNSEASLESDPTTIIVKPLPLDAGSTTPDTAIPRVAARASSGGAATTADGSGGPAFFGVHVQARSVVFVIDRSISMEWNGGLKAAKRELLAILERLPATTRFQAYFYNRAVESLPSADRDGLLANTEETRWRVIQMVNRIHPKGGTEHALGLRQALKLRPEAILFITDGDDLLPDQVLSITEANAGRTAIHTLLWGFAENEPLRKLAAQNGGVHRRLGEAAPDSAH
jgi:hypothetical protein